jgi:TRAP transporter TAXI family solute receptor
VGGIIANVISGPPGSMPCDLGGSCGVPGLIAAAVSTQGSLNNIQEMAAEKLDLALCQANIAHDAYTGAGLYAGKPVGTLRTIANLFPEAVHIVVRRSAEIRNIAALKGRRVSLGEENSGTLATARIVMRGYGLPMKDLVPVYERLVRSAEMLSTGEIDAFFMVGGPPIAAIAHVAERVPIALLPISGREAERIVEKQRFFSPTIIPDIAYPGVPATETIGVGAHLLVSAGMDEKLVYAITRALWDPRNRRVLDNGSPNGRRIQLRTALDGLAVPLHEGARRFYVESGITKAGQL